MSLPFHYQANMDFRSEKGKRRVNEDYAGFFLPTTVDELRRNGRLYIVADGIGGASEGEKASQYAVQRVLSLYCNDPDPNIVTRLRRAIQQASNDIYDYSQRKGPGLRMGTTMVAAALYEDRAIIANVGDSRAYLIRNGVAQQITVDHTTAGMLQHYGDISEEEALNFRGKNQLTRSLGSEYDVSVDVYENRLFPGDRLLLCSDGLSRYALSTTIAQLASKGTPRQIVDRCIQFAYSKGAADNVTVMVIEIGQPAADLAALPEHGQAKYVEHVTLPDEVETDPYPPQVRSPHRSALAHVRGRLPLPAATLVLIALSLLVSIFAGRLLFSLYQSTIWSREVTVSPETVVTGTGADEAIQGSASTLTQTPLPSATPAPISTSTATAVLEATSQIIPTTELPQDRTTEPRTVPSDINPYWDGSRCLYKVGGGDSASSIIQGFTRANPNQNFNELFGALDQGTVLQCASCRNYLPGSPITTTNSMIHPGDLLHVVFVSSEAECRIGQ